MPNTPVRGTQFSRRDALRLAAVAVPAVAAMGLPGFAGIAAAAAVKPSSATTGVPAGIRLTRHNGDIVVTTPGTILDALDIYGFVKIRAANVAVKRCRVRGSGPGTNNTGLVDCNNANVRNALIQDCLLVPDHPSVWLDGVIGKEYTARRCNVYNTVDGFGAYNASNRSAPTNVTIDSCYIHDLSYFSKDPNHGNGPTHNDAIQIQGGANIKILGNQHPDLHVHRRGHPQLPVPELRAGRFRSAQPGTGDGMCHHRELAGRRRIQHPRGTRWPVVDELRFGLGKSIRPSPSTSSTEPRPTRSGFSAV